MSQRIRTWLRSEFFDTLRRAFATDDGRQIAVDALDGLLVRRPSVPVTNVPSPYAGLGEAAGAGRRYEGTVFITARFRTGSTLLWNIFRHIEACVSYYEPLNERRWFDASARGPRLDATHRGVEDYWREYEGLMELGPLHRESWTDRALYLDEGAWDSGLREYFDRLIQHASPKRAVLQCNRIDFRLPWIRRQFPGATLLHLYRHPRDQWCSALVKPADVPRDLTLRDFEPHDHFYLGRWTRDLQRHFPFLAEQGNESAYRAFYLIWRLSYLFGVSYADRSIAFEDLARNAAPCIGDLLATCGLDADAHRLAGLVTEAPIGRWHGFADDDWFRAHEAACEDTLAAFFRG